MKHSEIRAIALEGDRETMVETLIQIADALAGKKDKDYDTLLKTTGLAPQGARLLYTLWKNKGKLVGYERLQLAVGNEDRLHVQVVKNRVSKKLAHLPMTIETLYGEGYVLVVSGPLPWE